MKEIVVIGGGWAGCAAAIAAKKAGAKVTLLERTDLLLGLGNVGGLTRNNGRYTDAEESILLGGRELFEITDRCSRHKNVDLKVNKETLSEEIQEKLNKEGVVIIPLPPEERNTEKLNIKICQQ